MLVCGMGMSPVIVMGLGGLVINRVGIVIIIVITK
jgi:hypothetical protein